jgi:putative peptidoglycan lipid II flippase
LGALLQVALQLPGLRDARLHFELDIQHPALRRVGKLYLPIILGLVISQIAIALDRNFASRTGEQSIAWMQFATTIIQFPLGLVSTAISLAILPTLSRLALATGETGPALLEFMATLATGLRLVLILIIPATVALFILAEPIVSLLFQHGDFTAFDTQQTALALRLYLLGLTFAAIDQPLIFAFYARQNTLTPALVGLLGVGFYLAAALLPSLARPMQMTDLVVANSVQLTGHALLMLWLVNRLAPLRRHGLGPTTFKAMTAALSMGLVLWAALPVLKTWLQVDSLTTEIVLVAILTVLGSGIYLLILYLLRTQELSLLSALLKRFLPKHLV